MSTATCWGVLLFSALTSQNGNGLGTKQNSGTESILHWRAEGRFDPLFASSYPPYWSDIPDDLSAFPAVDNVTIIDPWDYRQRMAMYKILLKSTKIYMKDFGADNTGNILWGLPLQHGWQFSTGRLRDFSNKTMCGLSSEEFCISPMSWWASMNYYLSSIPFLGALNAGLFIQVSPDNILLLSPKPYMENFCISVKDCSEKAPEALDRWTSFFNVIRNESKTNEEEESKGSPNVGMSSRKDAFLKAMWNAHIESIHMGSVFFQNKLPFMSKPEEDFGVGWANIVGFIAAVHFPTDQPNTYTFQKLYLPPRTLHDDDKPPNIHDFTKGQNEALYAIHTLRKFNDWTGNRFLQLWERAMCNAPAREVGRQLMEVMVTKPYLIPGKLIKILWYMAVKPCD